MKSRGSFWLPVWGRLKPGVTYPQATADMNHVLNELGKQFPEHDKGKTAQVVPIVDGCTPINLVTVIAQNYGHCWPPCSRCC